MWLYCIRIRIENQNQNMLSVWFLEPKNNFGFLSYHGFQIMVYYFDLKNGIMFIRQNFVVPGIVWSENLNGKLLELSNDLF